MLKSKTTSVFFRADRYLKLFSYTKLIVVLDRQCVWHNSIIMEWKYKRICEQNLLNGLQSSFKKTWTSLTYCNCFFCFVFIFEGFLMMYVEIVVAFEVKCIFLGGYDMKWYAMKYVFCTLCCTYFMFCPTVLLMMIMDQPWRIVTNELE